MNVHRLKQIYRYEFDIRSNNALLQIVVTNDRLVSGCGHLTLTVSRRRAIRRSDTLQETSPQSNEISLAILTDCVFKRCVRVYTGIALVTLVMYVKDFS